MESLKEYYLLTEDTTASTYFEGVIVDCWNLRNLSEVQFKKKILLQTNVKKVHCSSRQTMDGSPFLI